MNKKLNWDEIYTAPVRRNLGNKPGSSKYGSGKEMMLKAFEASKMQDRVNEVLNKARPAMEALLKCRLEDRLPLTVVRPLSYMSSEIVHQRDQFGEVYKSAFQDVQKQVYPGTILILKSLDQNLQEFIFEDQKGREVSLPYASKNQLMTQTNIYEDVLNFLNQRNEE